MKHPATRRKAAALETRRLILAAAKAIYSEEGAVDAPISRLARQAGVAEGTIFSHFPDKPSLLAAALEDEIDTVLTAAWADTPRHGACRDQLLYLASRLYAFYSLRPALFRVLVKESLFLRGEWGRRVVEYTLRFVGQVAQLIEEAKRRGEYRETTDSLLAGRSFFGLYFIELVDALSAETFDADQATSRLDAAWNQFEQGLLDTTEGRG